MLFRSETFINQGFISDLARRRTVSLELGSCWVFPWELGASFLPGSVLTIVGELHLPKIRGGCLC